MVPRLCLPLLVIDWGHDDLIVIKHLLGRLG